MSEYGGTTANLRVGAILQRIRQELGRKSPKGNRYHPVSQAEFGRLLAERLGTNTPTQSTISEWEGGESAVPAAALIAALQLLGENDPTREELLRELNRNCVPIAA